VLQIEVSEKHQSAARRSHAPAPIHVFAIHKEGAVERSNAVNDFPPEGEACP
jgi:hypothetical protein